MAGDVASARLSIEPGLEPSQAIGRDRTVLARALAEGRPGLRFFTLAQDTVVLGRYHRRPDGHGMALARRLSGGRIVPGGEGFVGIALALPHRSALVGANPRALSAEQVLNRCVRGLLDGLRRLGIEPFYPGRDLVTVGGQAIAVIGLEVMSDGATLFEAVLAMDRDLTVLPTWLDRADPEGVVAAHMWTAGEVTCVGARTGRTWLLEDLAGAVTQGYHDLFDLHFAVGSDPPTAIPDDGWLDIRRHRPELDCGAHLGTMLGRIEAHGRRDGTGAIASLELAGDVLANATAVERLEQALVGVLPTAGAVHARVIEAFSGPDDFLLGVLPRELTEVIVRAFA